MAQSLTCTKTRIHDKIYDRGCEWKSLLSFPKIANVLLYNLNENVAPMTRSYPVMTQTVSQNETVSPKTHFFILKFSNLPFPYHSLAQYNNYVFCIPISL